MNRKDFLKELRSNLSFLRKKELEEEVLYYINKIDESNKNDEEVIKSFGNMDTIVKEVCDRHGFNYKVVYKPKRLEWLKNFYNELVSLSTKLKNSDNKMKTKIIVDVLILIVVTCLIKIPFIFIRDLGDRFIEAILNNDIHFLAIWGLIIEIIYVVLAIMFFVKTFKKWFSNLK